MNLQRFPFFGAEVHSTNVSTSRPGCVDINLLSWICFEGTPKPRCIDYNACLIYTCFDTILQFTFPYDWSWKTSLLLGGLLSATDPVAVVALLKELGASKKLSTIIEGESLMNDGYSFVQ